MHLSSQNTAVRYIHSARLVSRPHWRLVAALSATLLSSGCSRSPQAGHDSIGKTTEVAPPFSAQMWLQWDKSSRLAFVMGNLRGHWDGVGAGCGDANRAVRSLPGISGFTEEAAEKMRMDCGNRYKPSNRSFESYEEVVTTFYTRYPEDRIIEIQDVLSLLAGDSNQTAEDVHNSIEITQDPKR
jgi:hypothetical protein